MMGGGYIKDSSIWRDSAIYSAQDRRDPYIRLGIVRSVYLDKETSDVRYLVSAFESNDDIPLNCRLMRRFGGAFNYEDQVLRGYKFDDKPDPTTAVDAKAGDIVLVVGLNGQNRDAIIIGSLTHPARKPSIDIENGPIYVSEFNGIETEINSDGEYTVTFKGIPSNIDELDNTPYATLPAPEYDDAVGTSYFKFDKTGSFEINDNAKENPQNIKIDKENGKVLVNSGKVALTLSKEPEQVDLKCKILDIVSEDKISGKTKEFSLNAETFVKINSPKVAIGKEGIELLDELSQLIDALGKVIAISPVGPCNPLKDSPEWQGVAQVQSKIKEITGSL